MMIHRIILLLLVSLNLFSQKDTCTGVFDYTTQKAIHEDSTRIRTCSVINSRIFMNGDLSRNRREHFDDFSAFSNVESIEGQLIFFDLYASNNFEGFHRLKAMKGGLLLVNVEAEGLWGFDSLERVDKEIMISDSNLETLGDLKKAKGEISVLAIQYNENLKSLEGLQNIGPDSSWNILAYDINMNPRLESLRGMENMTLSHNGHGFISENENLNDCAVKSVCEALLNGLNLLIWDNAVGCNSNEEVLRECLTKSEFVEAPSLVIFPNPAKNQLTIRPASDEMQIVMTNSSGREVLRQKVFNSQVDISSLPVGMYAIEVVTSYETRRQLIIVK